MAVRLNAWKPQEDERLRELWRDGQSCSVIGGKIGRSRNAVIGRVRRLGLSFRGYRPGGIVAKRNAGLVPRKPKRKPAPAPRLAPKPLSPAAQVLKALKRDGMPIPTPAETDIPRIAFEDLEAHHCRFIALPEPAGPFVKQFCGDRAVPGLSYCRNHAARCFSIPTPRQQSAPLAVVRVSEPANA